MSDVFSRKKRSEIMSRVKGRGNRSTEQAVARLLRTNGISGWRRHLAVLGKPDFAFPTRKLAVFVDGCFWHGCPRCYEAPQQNDAFWRAKLAANRQRDRKVNRLLRALGWKVIRIWEHELVREQAVLRRIRRAQAAPSSKRSGYSSEWAPVTPEN